MVVGTALKEEKPDDRKEFTSVDDTECMKVRVFHFMRSPSGWRWLAWTKEVIGVQNRTYKKSILISQSGL